MYLLNDILYPTRFARGTADGDIPFSYAEAAYHAIPHRMEDTCHLICVDEGIDEMIQTQVEFAKAQTIGHGAGIARSR